MSKHTTTDVDDTFTADASEYSPREQKIIQTLQTAAGDFDVPLTIRRYDDTDYSPSGTTIKKVFGSWNAAKKAAGLPTNARTTIRSIDEQYFESIDSPSKAYWLGTLFACSTTKQSGDSGVALRVGRAKHKDFFVKEFAAAVNSGYAINTQERPNCPNEDDIVQTAISNQTFIENLFETGYPETPAETPAIPSFTADSHEQAFVRGYLESAGYFSTQGWQITVESEAWAEFFAAFFEQCGGKSPTVSEPKGRKTVVRLSNAFDVRSVFDACWPDQQHTTPSWTPYPKKILDYLKTNHPYPENIPYLSG